MSDPIKKFVQQHREAFDHLEPAPAVLERLRAQLKPTPVVKGSFFQRHRRASWLVAASLLLGSVCTYLWLDWRNTPLGDNPFVAQQSASPAAATSADVPLADTPATNTAHEQPLEKLPAISGKRPKQEKRGSVTAAKPREIRPTLATRLADSISASIRLAAILEIEESGRMDERLAAMLAQTMNEDGNTNVRLAALDVLSQHTQQPHVVEVFAESLATQDDPLVQLGLIKVAGSIDHQTIEESLFALTRDPYTFTAVKEEAYAVLLKQNKL
ncbi:hypothetical protein [Parapedobacter sp. DT-150]|uniref:hypothetical protein n=1 Tax=Parapedobacter sp. DT-150 TaxID=3396162 RepID=UPI003F1B4AFC